MKDTLEKESAEGKGHKKVCNPMSTLPVGMKGVKNKEISYQDVKSQPPLELLDSPNVLDYKIERLVRHF